MYSTATEKANKYENVAIVVTGKARIYFLSQNECNNIVILAGPPIGVTFPLLNFQHSGGAAGRDEYFTHVAWLLCQVADNSNIYQREPPGVRPALHLLG